MALHLADLIGEENVGYAAEVFRKNMEVAEILVKAREKEEKVEALELEVDEKPPLKKMKGVIDRAFNNFGNMVHGVPDHQVQNEQDAYLTYIRTTDLSSYQTLAHGIFDTISLWRDHQRRVPTLYVMAGQWFALAATSASSERTFSGCSHLVARRRASRTPENVELLIFVRSNMHYFLILVHYRTNIISCIIRKRARRKRKRPPMRRVRRTSGYIVNVRKPCFLCMILGLSLVMA